MIVYISILGIFLVRVLEYRRERYEEIDPYAPRVLKADWSCSGCNLGKRFTEYPFYIDAGLWNPNGGYEKGKKVGSNKQGKHCLVESSKDISNGESSFQDYFHVASTLLPLNRTEIYYLQEIYDENRCTALNKSLRGWLGGNE